MFLKLHVCCSCLTISSLAQHVQMLQHRAYQLSELLYFRRMEDIFLGALTAAEQELSNTALRGLEVI
jgi:hypothetical protein